MPETESIIPNYNVKDLHVVQKNRFIRSKKTDLSVLESKFIRFIISQISNDDDIGVTYSIKVSKLISELKLDPKNAYREILPLTTDIMQKIIYVEDGTKDDKGNANYTIFHWFDRVIYRNNEIKVKISEDLRDFLICTRDFTSYYLTDALELPTDNAIKLYELLISWGAKTIKSPDLKYKGVKLADNEVMYEIDFLRRYFNCEDKYSITRDFIKRIIDRNVEMIRKKLCIDVSYRPVKDGQKTTALIFQIGKSFKK